MRSLVVVSVLCLLAACQAPPPPEPEFTEADQQGIASEIERLSGEMLELTGPEDMEAHLAYWSSSAESYFVNEPALFAQGVRVIVTMEALRDFFDPSAWNRQRTNFTVLASSVAVPSPVSAIQVMEGHFSVTDVEGETGPEYPWSATAAWVKEDGAWKLLHFHQSWTDTPMESETEG